MHSNQLNPNYLCFLCFVDKNEKFRLCQNYPFFHIWKLILARQLIDVREFHYLVVLEGHLKEGQDTSLLLYAVQGQEFQEKHLLLHIDLFPS